jgi:hypothetical protein
MQIFKYLTFLALIPVSQLRAECLNPTSIPPSDTPDGYYFEYESSTDCTRITYTVRNKPEGLKTPVTWTDSINSSRLVGGYLPSCSTSGACDCTPDAPCSLTATHSALLGHIATDVTDLYYGIFKDEYYTLAEALVKRKEPPTSPEDHSPGYLRLEGFVETPNADVLYLDLEASSEFSIETGTIKYTLTNLGKDPVQLTVDPAEVASGAVGVSWAPLTWQAFRRIYSLDGLSELPTIIEKGKAVQGILSATNVRVVGNSRLAAYVDGRQVAAADMEIYLPAGVD